MYQKILRERRRYILPEEEEETFYSKKILENLVEEEGLNNAEDWFMEGYEQGFPEIVEEEEEMLWIEEPSEREVI